MRIAVAFLIFGAIVLFVGLARVCQGQGLLVPIRKAEAPVTSCPRLANPCDTVDCSRPPTKEIA